MTSAQPTDPRDAEERIRQALEASGLGTWSWDAATGRVEWDPALERIYGLAPGTFPSTYEAYLALVHPLDRERVRATARASLENRGEHHVEHRIVRPDGTERWVEGWGRVALDGEGRATGLFGVTADVTDRRRTEIRLARLQSVTEALANARTTEEVGLVAVHELLNATDALGSTLAVLDPEGRQLRVVATSLPESVLPDHWRVYDVGSTLTGAEAVRTGRIVVRPVAEAEGPSAAVARMHPAFDEHVLVYAFPITVGDRILGAIGLSLHPEPGADNAWLDFLLTLVNQFGQALERAALYEVERTAGERVELLARASRTLRLSLDRQQLLVELANSAVPGFADWCSVELLNEAGALEPLAIAHADPAKARLARELRQTYPSDPESPRGGPHVVRTGQSELLHTIPRDLIADAIERYPELREVIDSLQLTSAMTVPLSVSGRVLGVMNFVSGESGRHYDAADLEVAEEIARRAAVTIDNARLFEERSRIAETLQSSLRPPRLPAIEGLDIASRYRPGGRRGEVAGDFYDVFALREGSWLAVLGDVCGKGVEAAAVMALARYTIRTAALERVRPSGILTTLNEALLRAEMDRFCTACAVRIDQGKEAVTVTVASAGHPRPLLIGEGGARFVDVGGLLMGVFPDPELHDQSFELRPGESLLLYTDGVIEERSNGEVFGEDRLCDAVQGASELSAAELATRVMGAVQAFSHDPPVDDIALLAIRNPIRR
jgi:PAS domain S-box-containing protein